MSRIQSERFETAELLGAVLQEWLEGAKEKAALAIVQSTESLTVQSQELHSESVQLSETALKGLQDIPIWENEAD